MADKMRPEKDGTDTEKGFGTGLRAQLEKRRESSDAHVHKAEVGPNVELRFELTARPREEAGDDAGMNALREELAAAQARETELREALSTQAETYETAVGSEKDSGRRSGALDDRERKLAELVGREGAAVVAEAARDVLARLREEITAGRIPSFTSVNPKTA